MPVPPAPHILGRDPSIRRHELEYMPIPLGLASSQGYIPLDDWVQGLIDQAPFQVPGYAPGSWSNRTNPSTGPTLGDDANGSNAERFASNPSEMMILLRPAMYVVP